MKRFSILIVVCVMMFSLILPIDVGAKEKNYANKNDTVVISPIELVALDLKENFQTRFINDFRHRKVRVKRYNQWSPFERVSNNIHTGRKGGSITSTKQVSFGTSISGSIAGLGISTGASITSMNGYTLNVGANKRVYMGYRVYYRVETGINQYYDITNGRVIRSNRYTVKVPQYGEYILINY